jgi:hypothetical protein
LELESQQQRDIQRAEQRLRPRFKLDVEIRLYARDRQVVRGRTVDISESGISGLFAVEVPVGEVVRLELSLPLGDLEIYAMVRQRNAFRYGFQFLDPTSAGQVIEGTCRQLAMEQDLFHGRSDAGQV